MGCLQFWLLMSYRFLHPVHLLSAARVRENPYWRPLTVSPSSQTGALLSTCTFGGYSHRSETHRCWS
jgi:hypothetical protein